MTHIGMSVAAVIAGVGVVQLFLTWRILRRFEARLDARLRDASRR